MIHSLFSANQDMVVEWFDKFDKEAIRASIIKHLTTDPNDSIELCKEYSKKDLKRFVGYNIINLYEVNKKWETITNNNKGRKTFYKSLIQ